MIQAISLPEDRGTTDITFSYQKGGLVMSLVVPLSTLVPQPPSPDPEAPTNPQRLSIHKPIDSGVFLVSRDMPPRTKNQEDRHMKTPGLQDDFPTLPDDGFPTRIHEAVGRLGAARVERGIAQVGDKSNPMEGKKILVRFATPFEEKPIVVANALEEEKADYPDGFAVTLAHVSATGFEARIHRVDSVEQTWGQSLQLSWVAIGQ
jgi:hypothetical protein